TFSIPIGTQGLVQAIEASYSISSGGITTSYETGFTAQKTSVPEPSSLLGLSVVGLLALHRKKILLNK
ncbi:PEP-CTERM sorting domain-containing protein, partial [Nostoc sp. XA013]|nr:PEP-CTERM sorting domain-containing protein [Nostoc sp. XA013]